MIHAICRTSDNLARDSRRLIWAVAEAVDQVEGTSGPQPLRIAEWPEGCPDITASVERFFPTSILLRDLPWSAGFRILADYDQGDFYGFLTAIYMAETVENFDWGRLKVVAGRSFLQPPSVPDEDQSRLELMAALGKGVPMREEFGFRSGMILRRLRGLDPSAVLELSPAEQMALVTVAAARNGPAAFLSEGGDWPRSIPVQIAAANNHCQIHRFSLVGIPEQSLLRIRNSRYEAPVVED